VWGAAMIAKIDGNDIKVFTELFNLGTPVFQRAKQAVQNDQRRSLATAMKIQLHDEYPK
jgi:hypothetical protein